MIYLLCNRKQVIINLEAKCNHSHSGKPSMIWWKFHVATSPPHQFILKLPLAVFKIDIPLLIGLDVMWKHNLILDYKTCVEMPIAELVTTSPLPQPSIINRPISKNQCCLQERSWKTCVPSLITLRWKYYFKYWVVPTRPQSIHTRHTKSGEARMRFLPVFSFPSFQNQIIIVSWEHLL